jgi:hypothetical protein
LRQRPPPHRGHVRSGVSNLFFPPARRHNIRASLSQPSRERKADAAGSPDHHCRFVRQIKKGMTHAAFLRFAAL